MSTTIPVIAAERPFDPADLELFHTNGAALVRGLVSPEELAGLRAEVQPWIAGGLATLPSRRDGESEEAYHVRVTTHANAWGDDPPGARDVFYAFDPVSQEPRPWGIDFISDKLPTMRAAVGNPRLLALLEALVGPDYVYGYDHMVVKTTGHASAIPFHTDSWIELAKERKPVLVVGIYLDDSDEDSGLWLLPGTHRLSYDESMAERRRRKGGPQGLDTTGAVPLLAKAGDVIVHNAMTLHGSRAGRVTQRRTCYAWFYQREVARIWYQDTFLRLGHRKLMTCISERMAVGWSAGEEPYHYRCRLDMLTEVEPEWAKRSLYRNPGMTRPQAQAAY